VGNEEDAMRYCRNWQAILIALAGAGMLSGCYYDPNTGLTSPYPPPYGYPQPPYGYQQPPGEAGMPPPGGPGMPPQGEPTVGAPGPVSPPSPQADVITRDQFVERAVQRATRLNRNPQTAAQRAGAVFDQIDVNHVGAVTQEQIRAWREAHRRAPYPGQPPPSE
jgi:hypothetical protein